MDKETNNEFFVVTLAVVLAVVGCGFVGVAAADHGSPANFTVYPETNEDRNPSTTDGTYVMSSAGADAFESERGLKYIDYYWIESDQASFAACDPDNARVVGIDRGNNNTGTQVDVDLLEHMKNYNVGDNRINLELYEEGDFGGDPINLNAPDATIAVLAGCVENTGDPGWYQFQGYVNGTTYDDDYEEVYLTSHYFWIGDYENEQAAREELGAPPSEDGSDGDSTPTPTATSTPTPETPTDGGSEEETTATSTAASTPTPTDTDETSAGDDSDGEDGSDDSDGESGTNDGSDANATPTPGAGPGFGTVVAILALLSATLLGRR